MRRAVLTITLGLAWASPGFSQEPARSQESTQEESGDKWLVWKWVNFAILVGGLGYLIRKHAPAFFEQRTQEIGQAIEQARQAKRDAEAQASAIAQRMVGLREEIERLREAARREITAEGERIGRETEQRLQRIQEQSKQEIALISRGLRDELRRYSAQLAVDRASERIRSEINTNVQQNLVDAYLQDLRTRATAGART
jgi:F-type H+-transporting ATPase subunit b